MSLSGAWARLRAEVRERGRALLFRTRENRELEEELQYHVEREIEKNIEQGMDPAEARRRAFVRMGGLSRVREETRDARGVRWIAALAQDVRYGARSLRASPVFTLSLVVTLGLGVGAAAAMFSVVDALLLRPLPYDEPDRLVDLKPLDAETGRTFPYFPIQVASAWAEQSELFESTLVYTRETVLYTGGVEPATLVAEPVSPSFEETLGIDPMLGRGLTPLDARFGAEPVVLLSQAFWRSAYGGDPSAIDRLIELDGVRHRIVGVMPVGFRFPTYSTTDLWPILGFDGRAVGREQSRLEVVARLRGSERMEVAQSRVDAVSASLAETQPREGGWSARLAAFGADRGGTTTIRRGVWFLAGGVGLILAVALLNVVNLLLVRSWARARELATRAALGASRGRVIAQLMTESTLLALAGAVAATGLAFAILRAMQGIIPVGITFFAPHEISLERRTLSFTFAVALAAGLVVGLIPAVFGSRGGTGAFTGGGASHAARTPARSRLRRTLVVAEVALSVALLVGAGLLINSFVRLVRVDPGFRLENVAHLELRLPTSTYPTGEDRMGFVRLLEERLEAIPGVLGATTGGTALFAGSITGGGSLEAEGRPRRTDGQPEIVPLTEVSPDYFDLLDVRIVAGRAFTDSDAGTGNAIVDLDLARFLWGAESPIGRRFRVSEGWDWNTVVGVVPDLRLLGPDDRGADFQVLLPASHSASGFVALGVRTRGDPAELFPEIRSAVRELDPRLPIAGLQTAKSSYSEAIEMPRFLLVLMSILSGLALILAAVGIYGVLAFAVAQRRFEIAVRLALGAKPRSLSRDVLAEGLVLAGVGVVVGIIGAVSLSSLIRNLLYGVEPTHAGTLMAVVAVSLAVAVLACWLPAHRATRVDPARVLKAE